MALSGSGRLFPSIGARGRVFWRNLSAHDKDDAERIIWTEWYLDDISAAHSIVVGGIASAAAVGTPTITPGAVSIAPVAIASAAAFGVPGIGRGAVALAPAGIPSAEAFGTATLANGVRVAPSAIASAEAFGLPVVAAGGVIISPASIDSAAAVGRPNLTGGDVIIPHDARHIAKASARAWTSRPARRNYTVTP